MHANYSSLFFKMCYEIYNHCVCARTSIFVLQLTQLVQLEIENFTTIAIYISRNQSFDLTVFPIKPWTPEKISGMFIVSRPIRCEMKPQEITDKSQQGSVTTWYETTSWLFLQQEIFNSLWISLKKLFFDHKPTPVTWQKPIYRIDLKVSANCENLQRYRSASWVKVLSYKKKRIENHQSQLTSMTFWTVRETNIGKHRLWLAPVFLLSDALSSSVWSCLLD